MQFSEVPYIITDMKRISLFFTLATLFLALSFVSCSKNKTSQNIGNEIEPTESSEIDSDIGKKWTNENGVICIVFGYGFNDSLYYSQSVEKLGAIYGLNQDGGLLYPLLFPDDLKNGIQSLHQTLDGLNIKGIIFLGAPDKTHLVLARYQDEYGGEIPFPVISLFPQDDILGQESTCSLIIDYEHTSDDEETTTETSLTIGADAEYIFMNAVKYMANLNGPLVKGVELKEVAEKIAGADKKVRRYIDRGSSMQSVIHYTVESY